MARFNPLNRGKAMGTHEFFDINFNQKIVSIL